MKTNTKQKIQLINPSREYIKDGPITLHSHDKTSLHLFLFNDVLIWTKVKKEEFSFFRLDYLDSLYASPYEYSNFFFLSCIQEFQ